MSTNAKTVVWIIVAVVIVGGGIWWWMSMSPTATAPTYTNPTSAANPTQAPTTAPTSTPTTPPPANDVTASGNSNAALESDLSNTDSQMNGFSSDNTNINNGMNDQPVQQSQY
jgi:cytoskeletal protein RodZ